MNAACTSSSAAAVNDLSVSSANGRFNHMLLLGTSLVDPPQKPRSRRSDVDSEFKSPSRNEGGVSRGKSNVTYLHIGSILSGRIRPFLAAMSWHPESKSATSFGSFGEPAGIRRISFRVALSDT